MPNAKDEQEVEFATAFRVIHYHGPKKWIEATLAQGKVAPQGIKEFPQFGAFIQSGIVQWIDETHDKQEPSENKQQIHIPAPPARGN